MSKTIAPGTKINVKVIQTPKRAGALKTIVRLLSKSAAMKKENARLLKARKNHYRQAPRGGRLWNVNVVKQQPVKVVAGECQTILATLDVLTDLASVAEYVEVTPA